MGAFWLTAGFFTFVFLFGGGSRADILSLVFVRPLAAIALVLGAVRLSSQDLYRWRWLLGILAAAALLAIVQIIPLPPGLWHALPGHGIIADIDAAGGLEGIWRPISLSPTDTLNALFALFVPAAFLVLLVKVDPARLDRMIVLALALGLLSALVGVAQSAGPGGGPLYFYRITNPEFAVGLFSNRNHQAVVLACLYPMLAIVASRSNAKPGSVKPRLAMTVLVGIALVPLILITGSRLGVGLAILGILSAPWVYRKPAISPSIRRESRTRNYAPVLIGAAALAAVAMTAVLANISVFSRFAGGHDVASDLRFRIWLPIMRMTWNYFPFGAGLGSFDYAYRIGEPDALLIPQYINHAHNDYLEVALTGGLPGVLIVLAAAIALATRLIVVMRSRRDQVAPVARAGAVVVVLIAVASLFDYPLRTPSIACIFILATVCLLQERTSDRSGPEFPTFPRKKNAL